VKKVKALLTAELEPTWLARLSDYLEIKQAGLYVSEKLLTPAELAEELRGQDILILSYDQVTQEVIANAPDLKLISSIRGGPEANVSIDAATEAGVPVLFTQGRTDHAVAELTLLHMLSLSRPICRGDRLLHERVMTDEDPDRSQGAARDVIWPLEQTTSAGIWHEKLTGTELYAKVLGIVGLGNIGRMVARLANAFGMQVLAFDPYVTPEAAQAVGVTLVPDLKDMMRQADFVSVHARVTPQTVGLLGREEFRAMKPTAYYVNTARAAIADEKALMEALQGHWIAGAGLDVYHKEPLSPDSPLLGMRHVILTPHLAGSTREITTHHSRMVAEGIIDFLLGRRPPIIANPGVFDAPAFKRRGALAFGICKE
jgi:D-3-phosphoglycerate dehydrogenase / 2-oxoglutarate reductase